VAAPARVIVGILLAGASLALIVSAAPAGNALVWGTASAALVALEAARRASVPALRFPTALEVAETALPVALAASLYHPVVRSWWLADDPAILWAVVENGAGAHFWSPTVWRQFSSNNLTPWEILSFAVDWRLFGAEPAGFYVHHLASLALLLLAARALLRRFLSPSETTLALCLFVASAPVATTMQLLMTRHYLEGLLLAVVSAGLFVVSVERRSAPLAALSAIAYLAACTAKEVLVPLVCVLPFLPVGDLRSRARAVAPHLVVAALYVPWRAWMLGPSNILAGYGSLFSDASGASARQVAERVASAMEWDAAGFAAAVLAMTGLLGVLVLHRRLPALLLGGSAAVASLLPLVPVLGLLEPRMLFVPSFLLSVALGAGTGLLRAPFPRASALAAAALLAVGVASAARSPLWADRSIPERHRVEGSLVLTGASDLPLLSPVGPPWYYSRLGDLRARLAGTPAPAVCYDTCACAAADRYTRGRSWTGRALGEVALDSSGCAFRPAPLTLSLSYDTRTGTLRWSFGPYEAGKWIHFDESGYGTPLPARGFFPIQISTEMVLAIRYVSPDGWSAQSPRLRIDPAAADADGVARISWSAPSGTPRPSPPAGR
jgi:hypothetical protein